MTAIASLAVGIAASTAIFSLADALLLRPRPGVSNPATLVDIGRTTNGEGIDNFGYPLFRLMRERSTTFTGMSAHVMTPYVMSLGDAHSSERVYAGLVSGNYFEVVGTRPAAGRFFLADEDRTIGTHPVVVLSHQFWTRRFGGKPEILGQTIRLNNLPYTVVGVAEPGFTGTTVFGVDFWAPMAMDAHVRAAESSDLDRHDAVWMTAIGRLKPGVSARQGRDELASIMRAYFTERGDDRRERWGVAVETSTRVPPAIAGPVVGFIAMLGVLTMIVLLIACSNVAGMLLARALERRREVATRLAVGATRGRVLRQLLMEGLILALLAGALSIPLTVALVALLASYQPGLPLPIAIELRIDPRVIGVAFALSTLSAVAFALLPGLRSTTFALAPALHGAHSTMERRRAWLRHGLVAGQVAMALLLLVAAGLFVRSLQKAASIDAGFDPRDVDIVQIDTRIGGYRTDAEGVQAVMSLIERFKTVPGVTAAGASRMVPLQGGGLGLGGLRAPGYQGPDGTDRVRADWDVISPDYFKTLRLDIRQGRAFDERDRDGAPYVVIVNETMAERLWPGKNPVGMQLLQATAPDTTRTLHVVGVAKRGKYRTVAEAPRNFVYVPLAQQFLSDITFYVRHDPGPSRANDLRQAVVSFNPMLPVIHTQPLDEATAIGLLPQRLAAWVAGSVGVIGLLLAALGLYGMTSFAVAQRTREIAIRVALGASRRGVLWMILRQAAALAAIGAAAGLLLAAASSALLQSLLVGLGPLDPIAFGAAALLLAGVLLVASLAPARRAARMDPMRALRSE
ncbi:MAG TPA: ADOP family duplicated permease [Vicinamibacterales bacterium]|nr:ADOP family duplicated permease [Vicinamibacterales bacterium]